MLKIMDLLKDGINGSLTLANVLLHETTKYVCILRCNMHKNSSQSEYVRLAEVVVLGDLAIRSDPAHGLGVLDAPAPASPA